MQTVLFCHSLLSDWNHGNAHFLRGVVAELQVRGYDVRVYEPADAWSAANLLLDAGQDALHGVLKFYPHLQSIRYDPATLDLEEALDEADLVLVHEWNPPDLVGRIGRHRARGGRYRLLFHDTHHRSVTRADEMARYPLDAYDGVLAFGEVIRERYIAQGWARRAWTWHEAADTSLFSPRDSRREGDLVWIGNWGDEERSDEIRQYLIGPATQLGLRTRTHGVRYPQEARDELAGAGIDYGGWLPNYRVPDVFARFAVTVHIPRRPYVEALPGIPTIRVFEALACGIPLVSCWWHDCEGLFRQGEDYLRVRTPEEMTRALYDLLRDHELASAIAASGRETVLAKHTCAHRVDELCAIVPNLAVLVWRKSSPHDDRHPGPVDHVVLGQRPRHHIPGASRALAARGHDVLFLERNAPWYAENRDLPSPSYCRARIYEDLHHLEVESLEHIRTADLVIVGSYVPEGREVGDLVLRHARGVTAFYDIDTPVTLARIDRGVDYLAAKQIPAYDLYLSFTGGPTLDLLRERYGARNPRPLYCSVDPDQYSPDPGCEATFDLGYLGTYSDDRQPVLDRLMLQAAARWPRGRFTVVGPQYPASIRWPANVERNQHLAPDLHRGFYTSLRYTMNVTRRDMVQAGYSPSVRLFEASACGTPIISDRWPGIGEFFEPGSDILLSSGATKTLEYLRTIPEKERIEIGRRARARVLKEHTSVHRAEELETHVESVRRSAVSRPADAVLVRTAS